VEYKLHINLSFGEFLTPEALSIKTNANVSPSFDSKFTRSTGLLLLVIREISHSPFLLGEILAKLFAAF
jgi:hypothetical protein